MTKIADHLISPKWIAPVKPKSCVLENHSVAILGGRIIEIQKTKDILRNYPTTRNISLPNHLLTPGFINTHSHAAMTLLRGIADDRNMMDWLSNWIWPIESKLVDKDFVYDGTLLAGIEMIKGGTTTVADSYFYPNASAKAYEALSLRAQIGIPVLKFDNSWARGEKEHISRGLELHFQLRNDGLKKVALAPHAPYSVSDEGFKSMLQIAEKHDLRVQLHLHETNQEISDSELEWGTRPIARLEKLGFLNERLQAVHLTQLTQSEIDLLAVRGIQVSHCPESNMKLGSGICPLAKLRAAGINVAIGTDGAASNNDLDMLQEVRTASFLSKAVTNDATTPSAFDCLEMITLNGARLLGLEQNIGSIEKGKEADLTAIDLSSIIHQPIYNPVSQLIYNCTANDITNVWIKGKQLLKNKQLCLFEAGDLDKNVENWKTRILNIIEDMP